MLLNNPVTKSKAAFLMSAQRLFKQNRHVYFWTFTFVDVLSDERAMFLWSKFNQDMKQMFVRYNGLRVVEVHGGTFSHGLHFHALIGKRMNIHLVKRIAKRWGFGRISVKRCDENAALYLSKYLSKENEVSSGIRKWACIGGFKGVKTAKIQCESILSRNIQWVQDKCKIGQFSYAFFLHISKQTLLHGPIDKWPDTRCIVPWKSQCKTVREVEADDDGLIVHYVIRPPLQVVRTYNYELKQVQEIIIHDLRDSANMF